MKQIYRLIISDNVYRKVSVKSIWKFCKEEPEYIGIMRKISQDNKKYDKKSFYYNCNQFL